MRDLLCFETKYSGAHAIFWRKWKFTLTGFCYCVQKKAGTGRSDQEDGMDVWVGANGMERDVFFFRVVERNGHDDDNNNNTQKI